MSKMQETQYDEYDADCFAYKIKNINTFRITVNFPYMHGILEGDSLRMVTERLYSDTVNLIERARFFNLMELTQSQEEDHISLRYSDDIYDFRFMLYQDRLVLQKAGGKLATFYRWYRDAVIELEGIVLSLMALFKEISGREVEPTRVVYVYRFIAHDLVEEKSGEEIKNTEIMKKILTKVPNEEGEIKDFQKAGVEISRLDYSASTWIGDGEDRRVLRYQVEAPSNNEYTSIWLTFQYDIATYTDPKTSQRTMGKAEDLLREYDRAFELTWKNGLNGLMKTLFSGIKFETTASTIP